MTSFCFENDLFVTKAWLRVPAVFSWPLTQWPDFEVTLTLGKALQLSQTYNIHPRSTFLFYLEAVFEPLGHKVEDYGIDARVDGCHVDAEVVKHKQKTANTEEGQTVVNKKRFKRRSRLSQYHCHVWQDKYCRWCFCSFILLKTKKM